MDQSDIPSAIDFGPRKKWEELVWNKLLKNLKDAPTLDALERALAPLLDARTRQRFIHRYVATLRIRDGASYTAIGKELWLSPQTISAIKKSMQANQFISYNDQERDPANKRRYEGSWLPETDTRRKPPERNPKRRLKYNLPF